MPRTSHHSDVQPVAQAAVTAAELWATEVVPHLPPDLEAQARSLGAFQRRRAVAGASDLLRALLASVLVATSLQHLAAWAVLSEVADISAPAWHRRLRRSAAWLAWLLGDLLAAPPAPAQGRLFPQADGHILLVDATYLGQVGGTGDDWRLHTAFNFTRGRLVQVTVTDRQGGEHLGYYRIHPGDIVVADNGYGYRRSVGLVRRQQGHLVVRIRPATFPFETADGTVLDIPAQLRRPGATVRSWQGWCTTENGDRYAVRLIAAQLPPAEAAAARRRARAKARKHGRQVQAVTLLIAGWVLVITTLDARRWDDAAVLRLYRVRWQIERVFKRMKSILRLGSLRARQAASIEASIVALLVAWALHEPEAAWVRQVLAHLTGDVERIVSTWTLTVLSVDVLRQQVRGSWGQARLHTCLPRLQRFLTSRVRTDRTHQEQTVRAWLDHRPLPTLTVPDDEVDLLDTE